MMQNKSNTDIDDCLLDFYKSSINSYERYIKNSPEVLSIQVRDTLDDTVHIVGTDPHDNLYVHSGQVVYQNYQTNGSTLTGEYEFVDTIDPELEYVLDHS